MSDDTRRLELATVDALTWRLTYWQEWARVLRIQRDRARDMAIHFESELAERNAAAAGTCSYVLDTGTYRLTCTRLRGHPGAHDLKLDREPRPAVEVNE